ncbi:thioredoxin-like protein Clot [Juglans microcarpa x Juglans regia]|uniref:thioredoxin-like protein Clot n=1 Tax=Juglans microcarpa x Juglans regia TaxID=2249226 RepID=UPI001B7F58F5|nr:thioredoxin-like protein Clot [Juglans microcarpa x Juglans regia]
MPMKVLDATVSTFDTVFQKFISEASKNKANLILFLADNDPSTSLSWCPDCVRAEAVIYKKLETSSDDIALLRAFVGDRPTWRNPQHPWRVDSRFELTGVPTLVLWQNDAVQGRLEDHEAHIEKKIDALVSGIEVFTINNSQQSTSQSTQSNELPSEAHATASKSIQSEDLPFHATASQLLEGKSTTCNG